MPDKQMRNRSCEIKTIQQLCQAPTWTCHDSPSVPVQVGPVLIQVLAFTLPIRPTRTQPPGLQPVGLLSLLDPAPEEPLHSA